MDPKALKKLVKQMRSSGILTLKTPEIELTLAPVAQTISVPKPEPVKEISEEEHKEIKHTLDNIKSLMLGSDEDLIARMWPDLSQDQESA